MGIKRLNFNEMKTTKAKLPLFTFLLLFLAFATFAQNQQGRTIFGTPLESINPKNGLIRCVSSEYEKHLAATDANRATTAQFEAWLAPKVAAAQAKMFSQNNVTTVITIPVVVHVIHNGDAVGASENISDARVISQITVLNQDFRRMLNTPGYNTNPIGADIEIEFCLAQQAPNGTATTGINRVNLGIDSWSTESEVEGTLKPQTSWDPTQYFNIWVAKFSAAPSAELNGVLGYAQFPSNSGLGGLSTNGGPAATDGVIIEYRTFGSSDYAPGNYSLPYDKGRTATHEVGHYFGLRHIWGDNSSCTVNATDSFKDFCPDTPAANTDNYDCVSIYNSCPVAAGNDMTENYMDYTNDTCMNTFTLNQKARIVAVLQNSPRRSSLGTSTVCQAPLGTDTFEGNDILSLYPNPASEIISIGLGYSDILPNSYSIFNALGQIVANKTVKTVSDLKIDINTMNSGIYFIRIERQNAFKTFKFIKQ